MVRHSIQRLIAAPAALFLASMTLLITPVAASADPLIPTIGCDSDPSVFNTGIDASGNGALFDGEPDRNWEITQQYPGTTPLTATPYPPVDPEYTSATVGNAAPGAWVGSPFGNAEWIGGTHDTDGDWYYRYRFTLDSAVDPSSLSLSLDFYADNSVQEIWVNGAAQSTKTTGLPQTNGDPYNYVGFAAGNGATTVLNHDWTTGANAVVVLVKSGPGAQGFDVQARPSVLCPTPGLSGAQTVSPGVVSTVGQVLSFSTVVTNTGNVPLTEVGVNLTTWTGAGPAPIYSCPSDTLEPGISQTCTASYTVVAGDLTSSSITASATASGLGLGLEAPTSSSADEDSVTVYQPAVTVDGGAAVLLAASPATISGTTDATPGSTVTVTVGAQTLSTTVTATRTWSVSPAALIDDTYPVSVSVTDSETGATGSATQQLTVDTTAPAITIDGGEVNDQATATPILSGTFDAADGTAVSVQVGLQTYPATLSGGVWSLALPSTVDGQYDVTATVVDAAGNEASASQSLIIDTVAPVVATDGGAAVITNSSVPVVSGSTDAAPDTSVTVRIGDRTYETVVLANGTWSVTIPSDLPLDDGDYAVEVTITDAAGNTGTATQTLTVDTVSPELTIDGDPQVLTNSPRPTISGTSDEPAGTAVSIRIGTLTLSAVVDATGHWSVTPSSDIADGDYAVVATVIDAAGNSSTAVQQLTIDTTPPTVLIDGGAAAAVTSATPVISGRTDAEPGTVVTVAVGTQVLTTVVEPDGSWSAEVTDALPDGDHAVSVTITDLAGNVGTATQTLTIDTVPPVISFANGLTFSTADGSTVISGSTDGPEGTTVTVTVAGQTYTTTVDADGNWSLPALSLAPGTYDVAVSVEDAAGNITVLHQALTIEEPAADPTDDATEAPIADEPADDATADEPTDDLAYTGADPSSTVAAGLGMLIAGGGLMLLARRRTGRGAAGDA